MKAEAHAAGHGHEHEHEEVDFRQHSASQKQVDAVGSEDGEAVDRVMDATIAAANGQLVLRAQNKGRCGFAHGGRGEGYRRKEGQNVKRGQIVRWLKIPMWSVCNGNIILPARSANWLADLETTETAEQADGAGVKKNAQQLRSIM